MKIYAVESENKQNGDEKFHKGKTYRIVSIKKNGKFYEERKFDFVRKTGKDFECISEESPGYEKQPCKIVELDEGWAWLQLKNADEIDSIRLYKNEILIVEKKLTRLGKETRP
jgi:hypothetical protein